MNDRDGDGNGFYDEGNGRNKLLALSTSGEQANAGSLEPVPSGDGRHVVFPTRARATWYPATPTPARTCSLAITARHRSRTTAMAGPARSASRR
ncbi:MAG: hypothetical protein U1E76_17310 [Planctomycetota bacterium]